MTAFLLVFFPFLASAEVCTFSLSFVMNGEHPEVENVQARSSVSHVLGAGRSEDCFWRFPLRSELAQSYFERLQLDMRACSDKPLNIEATGVNHPDSFEQITGMVDGIAVSLSLKDKGDLSETLVVLRRLLP